MNFKKLMGKVFGAESDEEKFAGNPAGIATGRPVPISMRKRRRKANSFANKRMERGVQRSIEQKQRPSRLAFIHESMRQGVAIAKARRTEYVRRRSARWRKVVERTLPGMFAKEMEKQGLGFAVGSGVAARSL